MAKLNRITAKIFGETASTTNTPKEIGQFGSAKAGTYNATGDVAAIQGLPAWSNGWIGAVTPTDQFPPLPEMTGVHKVLSYQNAYLLQQGIPEWDSATTYYKNGFCTYNGIIYRSILDENVNNQPDNTPGAWFEYGSGDYANQDINNLTSLGNARLQFTPFTINSGTVINGNNHTLQSGSFIQSYTGAGTYTIEIIEAGNYEIEMYGAGGGWANNSGHTDRRYGATVGGGSGAGFKGVLNLSTGIYSVVVGAAGENKNGANGTSQAGAGGSTYISIQNSSAKIVECGGGTGGYRQTNVSSIVGAGGIVAYDNSYIVSIQNSSNGNAGGNSGYTDQAGPVAVLGGVSVYDNTVTGYGAGGGYPYNAVNGYFKITKLTGNASTIFCDPCTITTCDGRTKVFETSSTFDCSAQPDGEYRILKNYNDGSLTLIWRPTFYVSKTQPQTIPGEWRFWLDNSKYPLNFRQYNTSEWSVINDFVYIGDCTISNGIITYLNNNLFNLCLYKRELVDHYQQGESWCKLYCDGWCEQGGNAASTIEGINEIFFLMEFRDTGYTLLTIPFANNTNNVLYNRFGYDKTTSSYKYYDNVGVWHPWIAFGYAK